MIPVDVSELSGPAQKIVAPTAPLKLQELAAKGGAPGLRPGEVVAILVLLRGSDRDTVRDAARATLAALPDPILTGALGADLLPGAIDALAGLYAERIDVVERLLGMPRIAADTVAELAARGGEALCELIAVNEERLLANPVIIERLYLNKNTRMSTADRLVELAVRNQIELSIPAWKEVAEAILGELIVEPSAEPTPDDVAFRETAELAEKLAGEDEAVEEVPGGEEKVKEKFAPLYKRLAEMTMSQKIRRAILGTKEERMLLIRDRNRVVSTAAIKSPLMQESDVLLISRNRNMSADVLRVIATSPEWLKSYMIKRNLCENPKTPQVQSLKLLTHLREADLRSLAKSKNVTGAIQDAARRMLDRKK